MFWKKRKVMDRIVITLPEDPDESNRYKLAFNNYICKHHFNDLRSGKMLNGILYLNPMECIEILVDRRCNFDLGEMLEYIADSRN